MIVLYRKKTSGSESGVALIIALLVLLLITAIGMGMIIMSNSETNISANFRDEQTAYFASKAGVEEVRDRMRAGATNSLSTNLLFTATPTPVAGTTTNGVLYVTNPLSGETVAPWATTGTNYPDDEICKELLCVGSTPTPAGTWYVSTPASASTGYAASPILPWKWVRVMAKINRSDTGLTRITSVEGNINNNRVCWSGKNEVAISNILYANCSAANGNYKPVYELTALAVTPGGSRRMMQYEVTQNTFPAIPGAFVFDGSNPSFNPPNSNAFTVTGTDPIRFPPPGAINGVVCPTPANQPALGAYDNASVNSLTNNIQGNGNGNSNRSGSYTSGITPTPAVSNVSSTLSSGATDLTTVDGLTTLVNEITQGAGPNVYSSGTIPSNLGTPTAPVVNVVNGDLTFGGSGAGILLVTGQLTLNGNFNWDGLILVIGEGAIVKSGGGNGIVNGAMFAANLFSDTVPNTGPGAYPAYTNRIALGSNLPPGVPYFGWSGGGTATIQYDSCWIQAVTQSYPFHIVAQRELSY